MRLRKYALIAVTTVALLGGGFAATSHAGADPASTESGYDVNTDVAALPEISLGDTGDAVGLAQMYLNRNFNAKLKVDGIFGQKTDTAVRKAQAVCEIKVDGIVGKNTWKCLKAGRTPR